MNKKISIIAIIVLISAIIFTTFYSMTYKSSKDAYIKANVIDLEAKISGQLIEFNFDNNSTVEKGEIIAQIDSKKFEAELNKAQKKLENLQKELKVSNNDIEKINSALNKTKNDIKNAKTKLEYANSDYIRYKNAYKDGAVTAKDLEKAIKNLEVAQIQYNSIQNNLKTTKNILNSTTSKKSSINTEIKNLATEVEQAKLNLSYTTIIAPISGIITNKKVDNGSCIKAFSPILSITSNDYYIIANFKKSQIKNIKKGQKLTIKIDSYKNKKFYGVVNNIQNSKDKTLLIEIKLAEDVSNHNLKPNSNTQIKIKIQN